MAFILNIETSSTVCSVSVSDYEKTIAFREQSGGYTHAENLHLFIRDVISDAGLTAKKLSAVSVSKGPGSYTGLRIGVSAAKGFAFALNIPLLSVDTLQLIAFTAWMEKQEDAVYCPMIDARRMEVYTALYDKDQQSKSPASALIVNEESIGVFKPFPKIIFCGDGMPKCRELLAESTNAGFSENIFPSARFMGELSFRNYRMKKFEDVAYFEPYYLKEFFTTAPKK